MKNKGKGIKFLIVTVCLLISAIMTNSCVISTEASKDGNSNAEYFKLHMIDVGQGDAFLLETDNSFMLVDAGPNKCEKSLISYLKSRRVKKLKYALFTHPHEDHIGSGDAVLDNFRVEKVLLPDAQSSTKTFEKLLDAIDSENCETIIPEQGDTFMLDNAKITVISLTGMEYDNLNKYSLVIRVDFGNNSFLLTGDAESENEKDILKSEYSSLIDCDLLKIGHHGSVSSTDEAFLDKASPEYAFISCGAGNDYGHPHYETLEKLSDRNIKIYRTDYCGTTVCTSDGNTITVKTEF